MASEIDTHELSSVGSEVARDWTFRFSRLRSRWETTASRAQGACHSATARVSRRTSNETFSPRYQLVKFLRRDAVADCVLLLRSVP